MTDKNEPICSACGQNCEVVEVDEGLGVIEAYGAAINDVRVCHVSKCCDADIDNESELAWKGYYE